MDNKESILITKTYENNEHTSILNFKKNNSLFLIIGRKSMWRVPKYSKCDEKTLCQPKWPYYPAKGVNEEKKKETSKISDFDFDPTKMIRKIPGI